VIVVRALKPSFIQNRSTNFGISIVPEHQGNGYGPEAVSWLLDWCFLTAGLHRVELGVFEWNERARKIYERLGFVAEGRQRESLWKDGRWWDRISMGILEHEWGGSKKPWAVIIRYYFRKPVSQCTFPNPNKLLLFDYWY
jgi:hypothetical protein